MLEAQRRGLAVRVDHRDTGELVLLHDAEADAGVVLDLLLEVLGELLVALSGDDGERVDFKPAQALALAGLRRGAGRVRWSGGARARCPFRAGRKFERRSGLSQPSRSAEWEKMNFSGVSKLSSFSLSRIMRL